MKLSRVIPWDKTEEQYAARFEKCGSVPIPLHVALGALIIREKCGFTDEETMLNLSENNYMQYFVGYTEFRPWQLFAPSLMVELCKRIELYNKGQELLEGIVGMLWGDHRLGVKPSIYRQQARKAFLGRKSNASILDCQYMPIALKLEHMSDR